MKMFYSKTLKRLYCSNACQQKQQRKIFIDQWLEGKISGLTQYKVSGHIRHYIFKEQKGACLECGLSIWMQKPIPLQLDHIDGNHFNAVRGNLRLLCATCHAMTPTYKGRNRGRGKLSRAQKMVVNE